YDQLLRVPVALKLLLPAQAARPGLLEHLHHEIRIGRRVSHPNVCRLYDLGTHGRTHFITMELVPGQTLEACLRGGALDIPTIAEILHQVCAALDAAHRQGVVHRDLKPSNILLGPDGAVKVTDFGLARDLEAQASRHLGPVGTPAY